MTASVVWRPSRAQEDLQELEANLDAKAITVQMHHEELGHHSPKPKEVCAPLIPRTLRGEKGVASLTRDQ